MRNLHYYIKRFGALGLEEFAFNEVDALILSQMAYLDFSGLVGEISDNRPDVVLSNLNLNKNIKKMVQGTMSPHMNARLLRLIIDSPRYKNMRLNYYRSRFDENIELQFSAIVFKLNDINFIAFRGTDLTLIGWKEDFNMVFMDVIPSQEQCLEYVQKVASLIKGDFYIGGHSKGGNLACFAGLFSDPELQERMVKIFDFDGPGFKYDVFSLEKYKKITEKIKKYITRDSMVGVIMHNIPKFEVVRCYGVFIMQHDPFRWIVTRDGHLDVTESTTLNCKVFERAIKEWLDIYPEPERVKIVDLLFDLLNAYEKSTILDFRNKGIKYLHAIRKRYKNLDDDTVAYLKRTFREYWELYHSVRKKVKKEFRDAKKRKKTQKNDKKA